MQKREICQVAKDTKPECQTIEEQFFSFFKKFQDAKSRCKTVRDALT